MEISQMNAYVCLAKKAIEAYIQNKEIISPPKNLTKELLKKSGAFVTIKKNGELRGCIGTYLPTKENLAQEIIANAIAAASDDYRFGPIQKQELPSLSYIVYILGAPELVRNINELNPQKYGIIVKTDSKSGLLLPGLERIETPEKQVFIACQKAGINPAEEKILIYKFAAEKYE